MISIALSYIVWGGGDISWLGWLVENLDGSVPTLLVFDSNCAWWGGLLGDHVEGPDGSISKLSIFDGNCSWWRGLSSDHVEGPNGSISSNFANLLAFAW